MENFIVGIIASLSTTALLWLLNNIRKLYKIYSFRGLWLQEKQLQENILEKVSLVELSVSLWTGKYKLSGTMINMDGSIECRWHSVFCTIEKKLSRIYYFYYGSSEDTPFSGHEGFGSIILDNYKGKLRMDRGYYLDATSEKKAVTCITFPS